MPPLCVLRCGDTEHNSELCTLATSMGSEKCGMGGPGGLCLHVETSGKGLARFSSACEAVGLSQWYSLEINKVINAGYSSPSPTEILILLVRAGLSISICL